VAERVRPDYALFIQDDLEFDRDLLGRALELLRALEAQGGAGAPRPHVLSLFSSDDDERFGRWVLFPRRQRADLPVRQTQWFDLPAVLMNRSALGVLEYRISPIPAARWQRNPRASSGVGRQLTRRLYARASIHQCAPSLVFHGAEPSAMNPDARRERTMDNRSERSQGSQGSQPDHTPRVAMFVTNFLQYSQTFIYHELRHHTRYRAEVFAWRRMHAARFPFEPVHLAGPLYPLHGASQRFERVFAERTFDLVHAHFGPAGVLAARYARRHHKPLVVTFHGYDVPLLRSLARFHPLWLSYTLGARAMFDDMDLGLCASQELLELLVAYGVPRDKLVRHPVGIDLERFAFRAERALPHHALMIGRFVEKKGFVYGIEAFAQVAARLPDATLSIIGAGPLHKELVRRTRALGVQARVRFLGVLGPKQVAEELAQAAVLLAPSVVAAHGDRESGLVVVKEASASGTVPIGTLHGGIPEIIEHARTGFLVPERDVPALAERLLQVFEQPALRAALAAEGRLKMEREYDVRRLVAELEDRYDALVASRLPPEIPATGPSP